MESMIDKFETDKGFNGRDYVEEVKEDPENVSPQNISLSKIREEVKDWDNQKIVDETLKVLGVDRICKTNLSLSGKLAYVFAYVIKVKSTNAMYRKKIRMS